MSSDDELFAEAGERLLADVSIAFEPWFVRVVSSVLGDWRQGPLNDEETGAIAEAAAAAAAEALPRLAELVRADVDQQWTTPLQIVRAATKFGNAVLAGYDVPPVMRDAMDERLAPDDRYGLEPAALADLDPELQTIGLVWGAAKAKARLARRRADG